MIEDTYISTDDFRIHIRAAGSGHNAILFIHGNSCSADYWDDQLKDETLRANYRLIALDLPGHGDSDKSNDYSLAFMSHVILGTVQRLSLKSLVLAGLSYGTALIAETAPDLKNCKGFFLASPNVTNDQNPPSSYIIPFPELNTMISANVQEDVLKKFASHLASHPASPLVDKFIKSYAKTDGQFRVNLGISMQNSAWSDEFLNLINTGLPVKYIFGEDDRAMNTRYMDTIGLPAHHSFIYLKEAAHFVNNEQAGTFNKLLDLFCSTVFD